MTQYRSEGVVTDDLRSTPKGRAQIWEIERLILPPRRKRRIREQLTIGFCAEGWHSDGGSADQPSEPVCNTIMAASVHIAGEPESRWWRDHDGWREFHTDRPCNWKVQSSSKDGRWTHFYCVAEFPDEYRELTHAPESRVIEPGPRRIVFRRRVAESRP